MTKRGFSVPEILISSALFLLLSLLLFVGWSQGVMAWQTVGQRNEVLSEAQKFVRLLERDLESASLASLEYENTPIPCLSYASPFDVDTRREFEIDSATGVLRWQRQVVVSHDSENNKVLQREFPINSTQAAFVKAAPIFEIDFGEGLKPIGYYAGSGRQMARQVSHIGFALEGLNVDFSLTLLTDDERELKVASRTRIRNP